MLDYILVGFGLAGSSLVHHLENEGKNFVVFDDDENQNASKVAGGLYNPIVLKRFNLAWGAEEQLRLAVPFYKLLEKKLGFSFLREIPVHRRFHSVEEQNNWFAAMDKPGLKPFLNPDLIQAHPNISANYQFGEVKHTGVVDTKELLMRFSSYLRKKERLITECFDYDALEIQSGSIAYKKLRAKRLVFCEGFGMKQNPFFNYLPLQGNKGEYILIKSPALKLEEVIKATVFIIPLGNDLYKVGATYGRNFDDHYPSYSAKDHIVQKLENIISCDYTIVEQVAGIRPTVPDRRPLVGRHPKFRNLYLCNGFGSRGVLMAPAVTGQLIGYMEKENPLPNEMDIQRFYS